MTIQRRSERLRRKARQSMPGVSKPAAYKLYGSSYVCESEASIATSSHYKLPSDSRRARYVKSPHCLQVETSPADDEEQPVIRRRNSLMETVRNSLADSVVRRVSDVFRMSPLGRPRVLRAPLDEGDDADEIVDDEDEDDVISAKSQAALRALRSLLHIAPAQRSTAYLLLLVLFALVALCVLSVLSSIAARPARPPAAVQLRLASLSLLPSFKLPTLKFSNLNLPSLPKFNLPEFPSRPSLPSLPQLPDIPTAADLRALLPSTAGPRARLHEAFLWTYSQLEALPSRAAALPRLLLRFSFGGAWRRRAGAVTRDEYEEELEPRLLARMKEIAREEARSAATFVSHRERYAADKGLPPDYALSSTGASILWARPTFARQFLRYTLHYARALFSPGSTYTPTPPQGPTIALTPDVTPGQCWSFPGSTGALSVRLARPVVPTSVTIEHTPHNSAFTTSSAPRRFRVSLVPLFATAASVRDGRALVELGQFEFKPQDGHLASFDVVTDVTARAIVLEILDNHGHSNTCLYRFRVHGNAVEL